MVQSGLIDSRIRVLADDIDRTGFLMLDSEGPLTDHENLSKYFMALTAAKETLQDLKIDAKVGFFRIPDHARNNKAHRFSMIPVLPATDAMFIAVKRTNIVWNMYLRDVHQVAPLSTQVCCYMDAVDRRTGEPFTQTHILDVVQLAHGWFTNPHFVFRQSGLHVAQAIRWTLDWLEYEEQTP